MQPASLLIFGLVCASALTVVSCGKVTQFIKRLQDEPLPQAKLVVDGDTSVLIKIGHNSTRTPVVMWHGMGDIARGSVSVIAKALKKEFPGMVVFSVQIGDNVFEDEMSGYLGDVNKQVEEVCQAILSNDIIKKSGLFSAIGFSQGAQFLRAVIQRCPLQENNIRVRNFISLGGQHQGVFGLPNCKANAICDYIRYALTHAAYEQSVQENVVQAQYWHDPTKESTYREKSNFLADINNENHVNLTYKNNLLQLDNMILVQFLNDSMVTPPESSSFGFFSPNDTHKINPWTGTRIFKEDRLGLKILNSTYRIHILKVLGNHLEFTIDWFMEQFSRFLED